MGSDFSVAWQFFLKENNCFFVADQTPRLDGSTLIASLIPTEFFYLALERRCRPTIAIEFDLGSFADVLGIYS
jgi:hypothetical protein